jgi:hypothetical protein
MVQINRDNLKYSYNWRPIPEDDPRISGEPDTTLFNKNEGLEILYILNKYRDKYGLADLPQFQNLERIIKEVVPGNCRSQIHVFEWLEQNLQLIQIP